MSNSPLKINSFKPEQHSKLYWMLSDALVLMERSLKHIFKNMDQLLSLALQPIMFMLLFRYVFGGAINTGGTTYVNYLVAGILVQTAAFGATTTALNVATDLKRGIIDRFKSLPMTSVTVLVGHVTADLVRNIISGTVMILVGLLVGFRPTATFTEWLLALGLLLLFTLALSWLSAVLGLIAKSVEAVQWISFMFIFPLTFASSAFVPTTGMPKFLKIFAENQPVTHVIEALRGFMVGTPVGNHGWIACIWFVSIIVISIPLAGYLFRHKSTQ
jgi:ABC-2 type transport system permease protein